MCSICSQPIGDVDEMHHIWFYAGPNSNNVAVGVTWAFVFHLYAKMLKGNTQGYDEVADEVLTRLPMDAGTSRPSWCTHSCAAITSTSLKKVDRDVLTPFCHCICNPRNAIALRDVSCSNVTFLLWQELSRRALTWVMVWCCVFITVLMSHVPSQVY